MRKRVLAVDFDDVIGGFNQAYLAHHNAIYGTAVTYEDIVTYDMCEIYGCDAVTNVARVRKFCHVHHDNIVPIPGAVPVLQQLSRGYELHLVTSRCESLGDTTASWLKRKRLEKAFTNLHFTNGFGSKYPERQRSKLDVCREIGAVTLIDDALSHATQVAEGGIRVLLPDRPWNQGDSHLLVDRVSSWKEIAWLLAAPGSNR